MKKKINILLLNNFKTEKSIKKNVATASVCFVAYLI